LLLLSFYYSAKVAAFPTDGQGWIDIIYAMPDIAVYEIDVGKK
jgi:hypothetical protein